MKTSKSWEKVSLQEWLEDFVESGCELEDLESLLDQQREEVVEEMKRDIKKPFNKKEFVRLANEVGNMLAGGTSDFYQALPEGKITNSDGEKKGTK